MKALKSKGGVGEEWGFDENGGGVKMKRGTVVGNWGREKGVTVGEGDGVETVWEGMGAKELAEGLQVKAETWHSSSF